MPLKTEPTRRSVPHDVQLVVIALGAGLPAVAISTVLLRETGLPPAVRWGLTAVTLGAWVAGAFAIRARVVRPLRTMANMVSALRDGDYSIRARQFRPDDALGLTVHEINTLAETLRLRRLDALEATTLLAKVMEEIEVAAFTFDDEGTLKLLNRAAERLLGHSADDTIGRAATELGLSDLLQGDTPRLIEHAFGGHGGRWELRRSRFRENGLPHDLVVLSDLTRALRQEERQAWQRLIQVLRHEINNSLAPIQSLAGTMQRLLARDPRPDDWEVDVGDGLQIIGHRAGALSRFMASYARLTRLPEPTRSTVDVEAWVHRVVGLESRLAVRIEVGPPTTLTADGDQLDQLLINLVRNGVDAALETEGGVSVAWNRTNGFLDVTVTDDGPGLPQTENLFVPFFTTKPEGSGIGLVLSRQIAEAHGGTLALRNRTDPHGCEARLRLPAP